MSDRAASVAATHLTIRARALTEARIEERRAAEWVKLGVLEAVAGGMSEVEAARRAGVSRNTVRAWLGKSS